MTALSWLAVTTGFVGTWIAGRHRAGWLIGAASAAMCGIVNVSLHLWAFTTASAIATALAVRNWRIGPYEQSADT